MKIAKCIGVREITRVNIECPECGYEYELTFNGFIYTFGEPFLGACEGVEYICKKCHKHFELGKFEVEE